MPAQRTSLDPAGFAYVGCFTTARRGARGEGLAVYATGPAGWGRVQLLAGLVNPSFLVMAPGDAVLHVAHGDEDYVSVYACDLATGLLSPLGQAATGGRNVVHLALDPSGRHLVVANYATGSVAVLPVGADGRPGPFSQCVAMPGVPGPHHDEQRGSHPHQILFDPSGRFVLVPDKGHDSVCVFAFDPARGTLELASMTRSRPGAGPRHGAFHPALPLYWVLNELDSTIALYRWSPAAAALKPVQVLPTLPTDFFGASTAAAIAVSPCGGLVFASNRGHDSVAAFAVEPGSGELRPIGWTPAPGRGPRFITLHDDLLYVASEIDDVVGCFSVDARTGALRATGTLLACASPASLAFSGSGGG